jgi:hypothetical protein
MNDSDIGELLKAVEDVPLLNSGINTGIVVSTYFTKEHIRDLLRAGKPGITLLNTSLGFRNARVLTEQRLELLPAAPDTNVPQQRPDHALQGPQKRQGSEGRIARILPTPTPARD